MNTIKKIKDIVLIPVQNKKLTIFNSAIEKAQFKKTHIDADIYNNFAHEPLYMLIDTQCNGYNLNDNAITYNEALTLINMYY